MDVSPAELESTGEARHGGAAHWSDRAVRRLTQARIIGLLAVVIGAAVICSRRIAEHDHS